MGKTLLISIVIVPVLLGILAARSRRESRGLLWLAVFVITYNLFYLLLLSYLRRRWV